MRAQEHDVFDDEMGSESISNENQQDDEDPTGEMDSDPISTAEHSIPSDAPDFDENEASNAQEQTHD